MNGVLKGEHAPSYVARPFFLRLCYLQVSATLGSVSSRGCFDAPAVLPTQLETGAPATQATWNWFPRAWDLLTY